ncbi:hypothetical protein RIVERRIDER_78 [Xanthomonas phage RiverRider]|uniref:Uncharacterized protein n=1 Tax=Xanthomonas phage RiverRider TaxID=2108116 RepID=A0A2P1JUY0_9CAUD|nr:hypothetical protein HWB58_gp57 [Xanthomonas phage RiverRider]AVO23159.1 hypothetical protein RIVERRIDER_78 [Xanthomonas phage RiverRider]
MQTEVTTEALVRQLNSAKEAKLKLEKLQRLCQNRDFKELILTDYAKNECARLVQMSIHPGQSLDDQAKYLKMAQATGGIEMYILAQERMLTNEINNIAQLEEEIELSRQEDDTQSDEA